MELHRSDIPGINTIRMDDDGQFWVNGQLYKQSIIVTAETVIDNWSVAHFDDLSIEDFQRFADFDPEILVLGTGKVLRFPKPGMLQPLIDQKCGYEILSSRSACNIFNILLAEGRQSVAALLPCIE